jgi:membrane associated rhomboid family serine protease
MPPDERTTLFATLATALGIPLFVALVLDPASALLRLSLTWLLVLGLPVFVIARVLHRWATDDEPFLRAVLRDLRPDPLASLVVGERPLRRVPVVTLGLIVANVWLFYEVRDPLDYAMRTADPALWVWTNFSSLFMHVDAEHLWGNVLFLWIFGSALEPRIGRWRTLGWYFVAGTAGNVLATVFDAWVAADDRMISLGASGAIAGVMGLFVVRCHFARVGLPVPVFGGLGAPLPVGYRVHVNAMVLVGLYFCLDLLGARSQLAGEGEAIGYFAHLGGYGMGLCLAYGSGLAREGRRELLELRASRAADLDGLGPDPAARDRVLLAKPDHLPLRIERARARSKYVLRANGREDYEVAIGLLLKRDTIEAARLFVELFRKYGTALAPRQQLALTPALERIGQLDVAARALEQIAERAGIGEADRERALLQQARLLTALDLPDAAAHVYERLLREHPASRPAVEAKLARLRSAGAA